MPSQEQRFVIIVAGGSGSRMGADLPKQFLPLLGVPILMHTLTAWHAADAGIGIILVLPADQIAYWQSLCAQHQFRIPHEVTPGGDSRFQSTRCGLHLLPETGLVAVHDGVRPFVPQRVIHACYEAAARQGAGVAAVALKDSIRHVDAHGKSQALDRAAHRAVQTPQTFQVEALKSAFAVEESPHFTDDASVYEHAGGEVTLVEGSYENIKLTTPEDLLLAEAILRKQQI